METQYFKHYSHALGRDMEMKVYGHAGRPVLFIPCQDGRFFDFENFKMTDVWAPWIDSGRCMVFSIDTMDLETWSNKTGDPRWRIQRHEQWMAYITQEVVPFIRDMVNARNIDKEIILAERDRLVPNMMISVSNPDYDADAEVDYNGDGTVDSLDKDIAEKNAKKEEK